MSYLRHQERRPIAPAAIDDEQAGELTRRTVLAGVAAATAAATVAAVDTPARARSVDANSQNDMTAFVQLSAALTGIAKDKLSPFADTVDIKRDYFNWVNERQPAAFENLLRIAEENASGRPDPALQTILAKVPAGDDATLTQSEIEAKYLARSIVLMWYLGAWYDPDKLRMPDASPLDFKVISPKAYTQAWALRVAQAHPMGFSEMQFGYWTREPNRLSDFIGREIA
jgi:hypothetical protein